MGEPDPTIVAMGGSDFSEPYNPLLDDYILRLARERQGRARARVCFVPTASGDSEGYVAAFYAVFARRAEATHLALFGRTVVDLEAFVREQDVIYVGGGNTANLLAVWRAHGFDRILARAWEAGVVLAGTSAGSNCWFEGATTDSFGPLAALPDGLGFLPGSHSPHYDSEPGRRPTYQRLVAEGALPDGYAADDCAGLVFRGTQLAEVVTSRPEARAYRVARGLDGQTVETELSVRYLG